MSTPLIFPGDAAPWFKVRSIANERFHFDTCAGRYLLLAFIGSAGSGGGAAAMQAFLANRTVFNGIHAALFVLSADPADEQQKRLPETASVKAFWDFDRTVARAYGVADEQLPFGVKPTLFLVDPGLRVMAVRPLRGRDDAAGHDRSDRSLAAAARARSRRAAGAGAGGRACVRTGFVQGADRLLQ